MKNILIILTILICPLFLSGQVYEFGGGSGKLQGVGTLVPKSSTDSTITVQKLETLGLQFQTSTSVNQKSNLVTLFNNAGTPFWKNQAVVNEILLKREPIIYSGVTLTTPMVSGDAIMLTNAALSLVTVAAGETGTFVVSSDTTVTQWRFNDSNGYNTKKGTTGTYTAKGGTGAIIVKNAGDPLFYITPLENDDPQVRRFSGTADPEDNGFKNTIWQHTGADAGVLELNTTLHEHNTTIHVGQNSNATGSLTVTTDVGSFIDTDGAKSSLVFQQGEFAELLFYAPSSWFVLSTNQKITTPTVASTSTQSFVVFDTNTNDFGSRAITAASSFDAIPHNAMTGGLAVATSFGSFPNAAYWEDTDVAATTASNQVINNLVIGQSYRYAIYIKKETTGARISRWNVGLTGGQNVWFFDNGTGDFRYDQGSDLINLVSTDNGDHYLFTFEFVAIATTTINQIRPVWAAGGTSLLSTPAQDVTQTGEWTLGQWDVLDLSTVIPADIPLAVGATATTDGVTGLRPAASLGQQDFIQLGDNSWVKYPSFYEYKNQTNSGETLSPWAHTLIETDDASVANVTFNLVAPTIGYEYIVRLGEFDAGDTIFITTPSGLIQMPNGSTASTFDMTASGSYYFSYDGANWKVISNGSNLTEGSSTTVIRGTIADPIKGTTDVDVMSWQRNGNWLDISIYYNQTTPGTFGTGNYYFELPPGFTVDNTRLPNPSGSGSYNYPVIGSGMIYELGIKRFNCNAFWDGTGISYNVENNNGVFGQISDMTDLNEGNTHISLICRIPIN